MPDLTKLHVDRIFTQEGTHPFNQVNWTRRNVAIYDSKGEMIWEQKNVEAPEFWSDTAVGIAASKYFYRALPETSVRQLINRIVRTIRHFGEENEYFANKEHSRIFEEELAYLLVNQYAAFNSPVWFNCGIYHEYDINKTDDQPHYYYDLKQDKVESTDSPYLYPQNSACFIQKVDDTLNSMMELQRSEVSLFKFGSGSGTNFSKIRGYKEPLTSGGLSSGVLSFLRGFDSWAGSIKSGGTTRRSAKMVILDVDHPEIIPFINWKVEEEEKAQALIKQGYDSHFTGEAYKTVSGQNSNNSVRVPDNFMAQARDGGFWNTINRVNGQPYETHQADELLDHIASAAWKCADPGIQFQDTINKWHTCKNTDTINASNPCSEYLFLDNSACNLASLNLLKFTDGVSFNINQFESAITLLTTAMDIIVDLSSYPTKQIAHNSHDYRPLGIGFANLGGMLMNMGIPYDSDTARSYAAAITSLLTATGYEMSSQIANVRDPFQGHKLNEKSMAEVISMHALSVEDIKTSPSREDRTIIKHYSPIYENIKSIINTARGTWAKCQEAENGFRNAQISVIAPTGTIGLLMDCATTGIEPDFSLIKYKQLSDGGQLQIVNSVCKSAVQNLVGEGLDIDNILDYIKENNTIVGAPGFAEQYYPIFDCAVGERSLSPSAHLKMVAAIQPFISGAISKTVNLPNDATIKDIKDLYFKAWELGVKCLSIYRDGCKLSQPLNSEKADESEKVEEPITFKCERKKLPDTRKAIAHKYSVGGHEVYMHVGFYEDGSPGEIFLRASKEGTIIKGLLDHIALFISMGLQYGIPLESIIEKLRYGRFEPYGFTGNEDIPQASSLLDYVGQYLEQFLNNGEGKVEKPESIEESLAKEIPVKNTQTQVCPFCGTLMVSNGNCHFCPNCGDTSGCS